MAHATDGPTFSNRLQPIAPPVVLTTPGPEPRPGRLTGNRVIVGLLLVGVALRLVALLAGRNLWIDESMLALNLVERPAARLVEPLDWNQGAPVGFLLAVKAAITAVGAGEVGLRLVPFAGSVLGMIAFTLAALRLLPRPAAVVSVGLLAVSPYLVSYAAECKQYATDAAIAAGLFAVAAPLLLGKCTPRRWVSLALAGAAAVWFSHPSVFVLAGIGTALLAEAALARDRRTLLSAGATVGGWLASFAACYLVSLRHLGNNQYLLDYWNGHFLPLPPRGPGDVAWLVDHFFAFFAFPGGLGGAEVKAGGIAAGLFAVGLYGMWRGRRAVAVALLLPAVFALLASGLHKYPFSGRLLLFLVPLMLLAVGRGAWMLAEALRPSLPVASLALLGILAAAPAVETYQELRRPLRHEQLDPVLAKVRAGWQPADRMYVYYGALPAFTFYTREESFPADRVVIGSEARKNRLEYRDELARLKGESRVWLVFSHRHQNEEAVILAYAEGLGRCLDTVSAPGAAAYLFDFSAPPAPASATRPAKPVAPHGENLPGRAARDGEG